jgi:hypothetical protein
VGLGLTPCCPISLPPPLPGLAPVELSKLLTAVFSLTPTDESAAVVGFQDETTGKYIRADRLIGLAQKPKPT